jgi:predicted dehydrogenase
MSQIYNVAIIGAGIGREHIRGYTANAHGFRVRTICDLNTELAEKTAGTLPDCKTTTDYTTIFDDPDIDIVNICLPSFMHFDVAMQALAAGKHVVAEKPVATSLNEIDQIIARTKETGKRVFPVFQYRYAPGIQQTKQLIESGLPGRAFVTSLETHWQRGADYYAVPWRGKWKTERGGCIVGHAIHIHDLTAHLLGAVTRVGAFVDTKVNPIETEDCCAISFNMTNSALVTSSITLGAAGGLSRMRLCFEHVTIESGDDPFHLNATPWTFTATDPARQPEFDAAVAGYDIMPNRFEGLFAEMHKSLIGEKATLPDLAAARHSVELITAIYQSDRESKIVPLPLEDSGPWYDAWVPENRE